ncbi:MAG TPA: DinB family protein [Candidatus Acidoferrum sp.]|nr:DinB family protein [Candidatus Acidoferrum sp.]
MPNLDAIRSKLLNAQSRFLTAADSIPFANWQTRASDSSWSASEITAHLCQVESSIIVNAERILKHEPRHIPFTKRFRLPLFLVEYRVRRLRSPLPVDPTLLAEKDAQLGDLRAVRDRTLAFLDETKSRNLAAYRFPHPFLGMFTIYNWLDLIARHQIRHSKQVHEMATLLPNRVTPSQI